MERRKFLSAIPSLSYVIPGIRFGEFNKTPAEKYLDLLVSKTAFSGWNIEVPKSMITLSDPSQTNIDCLTVRLLNDVPGIWSDRSGKPYLVDITNTTKDNNEYYGFKAYPDKDIPRLLFMIDKEVNGTVINLASRVIPLNLNSYTHGRDSGLRSNMLSEVPLSQKNMEVIFKIQECYDPYMPVDTRIYIINDNLKEKGKQERDSMYDMALRRAVVIADTFTDPKFPEEGELVLSHELGHAIFDKLISRSRYHSNLGSLINAYGTWISEADLDANISRSKQEACSDQYCTAIVQLFDEAAYNTEANTLSKTTNLDYGQPNENYRELFASTTTILRLYPDLFQRKYSMLSTNGKTAAKAVVNSVISALSRISSSEEDLKKIIPEYESINKKIMV